MLFFSRSAKKRSVAARTAVLTQGSRPVCEFLETRQLLSGGPPADPSAFSATTISGHKIDLEWTNNATNADYIDIERSLDGGTTWVQIDRIAPLSGAMDYECNSVYPGEYFYRVRAERYDSDLSEDLFSNYSDDDNAVLALNAPTGLTAEAVSGNQIDLEWTNNADNADNMRIERSFDDGVTWTQIDVVTATAGTMTYHDTICYPEGEYQYRVRAMKYDGDRSIDVYTSYTSVASDTIQFNAPSGLLASVTPAGEIKLEWTNNNQNVIDDNMRVERSDDGGSTWTQLAVVSVNDGKMTWEDNGVSAYGPGVFKYRVRAFVNDHDRSIDLYTSYSNVSTCTLYSTPPTVSISTSDTPYVGEEFTVTSSYSGSGYSTIDHWIVDWGDGTVAETVTGNPGSFAHVYAMEGDFDVTATCVNGDGAYQAAPMQAAPVNPYAVALVGSTSQSLDGSSNASFTFQVTYRGSPTANQVKEILIVFSVSANAFDDLSLVVNNSVASNHMWTVGGKKYYALTTDNSGQAVLVIHSTSASTVDRPFNLTVASNSLVDEAMTPLETTLTILH